MTRFGYDKYRKVHGRKLAVEECSRLTCGRILPCIYHPDDHLHTVATGGTSSVGIFVGRVTEVKKIEIFYYLYRGNQSECISTIVRLDTTRIFQRGKRYWFLCPIGHYGDVCGRRVGVLYLPPGQREFGCRRCYDLTYKSCQNSRKPKKRRKNGCSSRKAK